MCVMLPTHPPVPPTLLTPSPALGCCWEGGQCQGAANSLAQLLLCIPTPRTALLEKSQPGAADPIPRKAGKPSRKMQWFVSTFRTGDTASQGLPLLSHSWLTFIPGLVHGAAKLQVVSGQPGQPQMILFPQCY